MRILVVEDDRALARGLVILLRSSGYAIDHVETGAAALELVGSEPYCLMILDIGLPDISGFDVLRQVRAHRSLMPVLILTARDALDDRVTGLDIGGDDYMLKPFDPAELEARVRALVRRAPLDASQLVVVGALVFDTVIGSATLNGCELDLRTRERAILRGLLTRLGKVVSKDRLVSEVFRYEEDVSPNVIELYVGRLRKKLEPEGPKIHTIRGVGYMISADP